MRKIFNIFIYMFVIYFSFGCGSEEAANSGNGVRLHECKDPLNTYKLILNWDKSTEAKSYLIKLSDWPSDNNEFCGFWVNQKEERLSIHKIGLDPITILLDLPYTDNSWRLVLLNKDKSIISGEVLWETWGSIRKVGYFEIHR